MTKDPSPSPRIVFPTDNRTRVNPTNLQPYYWFGQLTITFPSGVVGTGTGTLVGPNKVLTCAHNLYQAQYGGYATNVSFALARNGNTLPYGNPVAATALAVTEEYATLSPPAPDQQGNVASDTDYVYDFGVVTLASTLDPANGLYPSMYAASDNQLNNRQSDIAGYPGDKPANTLWNGNGALTGCSEEFLFYNISTYNGQSGSAVRSLFQNLYPPGIPWIIGVHVAGDRSLNTNFAVRLNQDNINTIQGWL